MLHAAAVALDLAARRVIVARGTLGPLLAPEPDQVVAAGDEPSRAAVLWREVKRALDEMIERAQHEPEIAGQLLTLFTLTCRTAEAYDRERDYVISLGIPPSSSRQPQPPAGATRWPPTRSLINDPF